MSDQLVTAADLAESLGVSTDWVVRHWQAGDLPGFRLSYNVVRFRRSEVEAWLETKRRGPVASEARPQLRAV